MIVLPSFYRFCITGVLNTVVHYLTASALFAFGDVSPAIANGGALIVATCFSLCANTLWSFSCRLNARIFARFLIISALACGLGDVRCHTAVRMGSSQPTGNPGGYSCCDSDYLFAPPFLDLSSTERIILLMACAFVEIVFIKLICLAFFH
jgi:hypothetical protein